MDKTVSTVSYFSNLQPITKRSLQDDLTFLKHVHDPKALEILKTRKQAGEPVHMTPIQVEEADRVAFHCAYALPDDYPWGTVLDANGNPRVICRCLQTSCNLFLKECRPDFNPQELQILEENKRYSSDLLRWKEAQKPETIRRGQDIEDVSNSAESAPVSQTPVIPAGRVERAASALSGQQPAMQSGQQLEMPRKPEKVPEKSVQPVIPAADKQWTPSAREEAERNFSSFRETTQTEIIQEDSSARILVNAGPGTGKTWTLIQRILHLLNHSFVEAERISVLCFSRSAAEVIKSRLSEIAQAEDPELRWQDVDIRTFDSFCTYLLAWAQSEQPDLLPKYYVLGKQDYTDRIRQATLLFQQKQDLMGSYQHIFVDEVQDLTGVRAELVIALLKSLPNVCGFTLLGDSCQSLYDYMAEDHPEVMTSERFYRSIFETFPNLGMYSLTENHRQQGSLVQLALPYRKAILSGDEKICASTVKRLADEISPCRTTLQKLTVKDVDRYTDQETTLGVLTRTNGQALQISAWFRGNGIRHILRRGMESSALGDWIACVFQNYPNETITEHTFIKQFHASFPNADSECAMQHWTALINTQNDNTKTRYEVEDLLKGLVRNAKEALLFTSMEDETSCVTISNIHRAKGKEFDHVIIPDDVIFGCDDDGSILEHKVCYVALTRPRKSIERAELSKRKSDRYIYINPNENKRCFKAGLMRNNKSLSHFEVGMDTDLEAVSFGKSENTQKFLRESLPPGTPLRLVKYPQNDNPNPWVTYFLEAEVEGAKVKLGQTGSLFAAELDQALRRLKNLPSDADIYDYVYPHAFDNLYADKTITCLSAASSAPKAAKTFGSMSIWTGVAISGFAAVDRDTY